MKTMIVERIIAAVPVIVDMSVTVASYLRVSDLIVKSSEVNWRKLLLVL